MNSKIRHILTTLTYCLDFALACCSLSDLGLPQPPRGGTELSVAHKTPYSDPSLIGIVTMVTQLQVLDYLRECHCYSQKKSKLLDSIPVFGELMAISDLSFSWQLPRQIGPAAAEELREKRKKEWICETVCGWWWTNCRKECRYRDMPPLPPRRL